MVWNKSNTTVDISTGLGNKKSLGSGNTIQPNYIIVSDECSKKLIKIN